MNRTTPQMITQSHMASSFENVMRRARGKRSLGPHSYGAAGGGSSGALVAAGGAALLLDGRPGPRFAGASGTETAADAASSWNHLATAPRIPWSVTSQVGPLSNIATSLKDIALLLVPDESSGRRPAPSRRPGPATLITDPRT